MLIINNKIKYFIMIVSMCVCACARVCVCCVCKGGRGRGYVGFKIFSISYLLNIFVLFVGAITSATINIESGTSRLLDRTRLQLVLEGVTTGTQQTSLTWRRNGNMITHGGGFFIGGGETIQGNLPCASQMYRVALQINGFLPGNYTYTADNANTADPGVTSPVFQVQGTSSLI